MARNVFLINENETLSEMNQSAYSSESELQNLVGKYPTILTNIIEDETGEKERWMLIKQEMRVLDGENSNQRWPVDHLFISNKGVPVLVEVKRSTDPRVRREVVGQMLDYASNGVAYWSVDYIRQSLIDRCEEAGLDFEQEFEDFISGADQLYIDQKDFWEKVFNNLKTGKIKMIFVADLIPKELRRIIEFLNQQLSPAEVLGIEIVKYEPANQGKFKTLVSKVIGINSQTENRKSIGIIEPKIPREGLQEACNIFNDLYSSNLIPQVAGTQPNYRQIKFPNIPSALHYEFYHTRQDGLSVEFHIETDGYEGLAERLKKWAEETKELNGYELSFNYKWSKGRGAIRAISNEKKEPKEVAKTMKELIDKTLEVVKSEVEKR